MGAKTAIRLNLISSGDLRRLTLVVALLDVMEAFDAGLFHFVGDRVIPSPAKRSTQVLIRK
ncbi:hypothetical protein IVA79_17440 [Bradyrhizobium sp. 138]|uniref:hypothetical protein n=1 Tax=Bradyrhizobium sp. 138 TaxID=2782615 RepID=UPI001FF7AAE5|nr:hypothetical protein [Bradyrhizobium sp. 138]MCK1735698.1 hypothetical protein [Bradyrhizobium sp. 138]